MNKVLAFDMGATSIRGIVGYIEGEKLITEEVMRMSHSIKNKNGRLYWDFDTILNKIADTIIENKDVSCIGIDTWGVDFGVLDKNGELIDTPFSYRDEKYSIGREAAKEKMSELEIFKNSGNQIMTINTVFQLLTLKKLNPDIYEKADKMLMMPDLIFYMLTGKKIGEETIWSTTGLYDMGQRKVSDTIFEKLELKKSLVPEIVKATEAVGSTRDSKIEALRSLDIDVIPVCTHDTASALLMTDSFLDEDSMFLSCGTWSLIGSAVDKCIINDKAYENNLTNELGFNSKPMFFKNITGLYLLEKYKSQLEKKLDRKISFDEISDYVKCLDKNLPLIDMDAEVFARESIDVKTEIDKFIENNGDKIPQDDFDYFAIIYESMVDKYIEVKSDIEKILNKSFKKIHIIGGGAKSSVLTSMIADKMGVEVKAGPYESSALGNILLSLLYLKEVSDLKTGIELILGSCEIKRIDSK
ncbi:carbohydrate kinase, FGGY family protein [Lachnoanaerobaculum saburreum F0468]|jgi:rhamnulokinase|uniref:Carbohydrate kinase, FGGY family protein n=1 Tax=Lachnoanaerobaculum saburreum F0468 TaxID=1095750 RepID=I0R6P6_9FIRM|nr:FGGY family carbohydrate kinase [Lachnoanaerobaculum saburreum]EIC95354.1 carbohydrate kinase, FGGY family protein [Lachnoanaerobaculum saburreum F0468]